MEHVANVLDKFPVHHFSSCGKPLRTCSVMSESEIGESLTVRVTSRKYFSLGNILHGIDLGAHEDEGTRRHGIASVGIDNSFQKTAAFSAPSKSTFWNSLRIITKGIDKTRQSCMED